MVEKSQQKLGTTGLLSDTQWVRQAVVLAAGEGQRLRPFTASKPKVMIPVANKPILQYVVEALAKSGITDIVMVVGYQQEQVQDYFGSGEQCGVQISYIHQKQQIGTGHALKQAQDIVGERFLVLAGDNIIDSRTIGPLLLARPNVILVKKQEDASKYSKYGIVLCRGDRVVELLEKPGEPVSNLVNTGIYLLNRGLFPYLEQEVDIPQALGQMIAQGETLHALEAPGPWLDAVYPWDIIGLNQEALGQLTSKIGGTVESGVSLRGMIQIGKDTVIRSGSYIVGPVVIGRKCQIGPHVCVFPSTSIGDGVTVEAFTQVRNSVIGNNVSIGPNSLIEDSVIDRACVLGSHFIARSGDTEARIDNEFHRVRCGALIGEDCNIGDSVLVQPGIMVGNSAQIKGMKVISANIPPRTWVV